MKTELLKAKILDLLIKGELTAKWRECHKDLESAEILLEKIRSEKEKLLNDELIAKGKKPTAKVEIKEVSKNDEPFEIPNSWKWCRLVDVATKLVDGDHNPPTGTPEKTEYLMISSRNINNNKIVDLNAVRYLTKEVYDEENKRTDLRKGDILLTTVATLGRSCIYDGNLNLTFQRSVSIIQTLVNNSYIKVFFDAPYFQILIDKEATGTAQRGFYLNQLAKTLVPIPPLEEQAEIARIAEKLLAMVDDVDGSYSNLEELSKKAKAKVLDLLIKGELTSKWRDEHKDVEAADILLEKIRSEKEKKLNDELIAKGKKPTAKVEIKEVSKNDEPFEIPSNWRWCHLGDIVETNIGLLYSPSDIIENGGLEVLRSNNIQNGKIIYDNLVHVSIKAPEKCLAHKGDLLICARNGSKALVGKTAMIEKEGMAFGAFMAIIRSSLNPYILYFLNSPVYRSKLDGVNTTTINQITQNNIRETLFPLPPLEEQKRIVFIAETLLNQIDSLTNINTTQSGDDENE